MLRRSGRRHPLPWWVWHHAPGVRGWGRIRNTCRADNQPRTCQRRFHSNRRRHDNRPWFGADFTRRNESISRLPPLSRQRFVTSSRDRMVTWPHNSFTAAAFNERLFGHCRTSTPARCRDCCKLRRRKTHWNWKLSLSTYFIRSIIELQHVHRVPKNSHFVFGHNFGKWTPIFTIRSLLDSAGNFLQIRYRDFHLTLDVLLHYLAKS